MGFFCVLQLSYCQYIEIHAHRDFCLLTPTGVGTVGIMQLKKCFW